MLASTFQRKIKALNPKLHIYCGDRKDTPAGLYIVEGGEYVELCGVDKNYINEWPEYDRYGKMIRGGWRRVLAMLHGRGLIDLRKSYRHFGWWTEHREPSRSVELRPIDKAISDLEARPVAMKSVVSPLTGRKVEVPVYNTDDVVDIGRMVSQNDCRSAPTEIQEGHTLGE